jgi:hypothetical protein
LNKHFHNPISAKVKAKQNLVIKREDMAIHQKMFAILRIIDFQGEKKSLACPYKTYFNPAYGIPMPALPTQHDC